MKKAIKIFALYIIFLIISSVVFAWLHINSDDLGVQISDFEIQPILIPTIIGGLIALWLTIPPKAFRIFVLIYICLWALRVLLLYIADQVGAVNFFHRTYRFDLIIRSYYKTISRLETPLPFIIFWFIHYFYSRLQQQQDNKEVK